MSEAISENVEVSTGAKIVVTVFFLLWLLLWLLFAIALGGTRRGVHDHVGVLNSWLFSSGAVSVLLFGVLPIVSVWLRSRSLVVVVAVLLFPVGLFGLYFLVTSPFFGFCMLLTVYPWYCVSYLRWPLLRR